MSDRFGLWLSFYPMDQNLYLEIVEHYLDKANMPLMMKFVLKACVGAKCGVSALGRAAYQFSKHWIGLNALKDLSNN
ncbi:DUF815 domain-containing protein [Acinetobacter baumannii]